jgi:hypothetical protein
MQNLISHFRNLVLRSLCGALFLPAAVFAGADLSVPVHSHIPTQPGEFDYITYSFTIHNNSTTTAAQNVMVTVASTGSQFFDSGSPYFFVNNGDGTLTATVGTVAAGADAAFTVKWFAQTGPVSITATVSSTDDPNSGNNSATESTNAGGMTPTADVQMVSVTVVPNPGKIGDLRHYHGTVKNNGPDTATGVQVSIQADSVDGGGFGYDAYETFDHSVPAPNPPNPDANGIRYLPVGDLAANASVAFDAYYNAVQNGSFMRNFFLTLTDAQVDPDLTNNHFVVSSTIDEVGSDSADLGITITAPTTIAVGSDISYKFHVSNLGPSTATSVSVLVAPSASESIVSATVPYTVTFAGAVVAVPNLASGGSYDFTFVFEADQPGNILLTGTVSGGVADPDSANNSVTHSTSATLPPPPPHGGLSPTSFTVDESRSPVSNVVDTVLRFAAAQLGTPAGLSVRVQFSTVPGNPESSWQDLDNGDSGRMTYDPSQLQFFLSSLNYPAVNGVSFRAISSASGYSDSVSNVVGPFNLASTKPRLAAPNLALTGNGLFCDLFFRTYSGTTVSGMTERVQQSTTPYDENSWIDLTSSQGGAMLQSNDPQRFYLCVNQITAGTNIYFRVIASHSGYADGISKPNGPWSIISDTPPTVTSLTLSPKGIGTGSDFAHPVVLSAGSLAVTATAQPVAGRSMKTLKLLFDGSPIHSVDQVKTMTYTFSLPVGDHIIEAVAVDDLGAQARLGTKPIYVRVNPPTTTARTETGSGGTTAVALVAGKVFTVAKSGGVWTDATTWKDAQGKNGVPGPNDAVIIGASAIELVFDGSARSVSIDGGSLFGQGTLYIYGQMTIAGVSVTGVDIDITSGAVCELLNPINMTFSKSSNGLSALLINEGTLNIHGAAGLVGSVNISNYGHLYWQPPISIPTDAGKNPDVDNRLISPSALTGHGLISSGVTGLISQDGNSLISQDGNSIVAQGGGNLVNTNGSNIVAQGGGNIVAQGGGNLVGPSGGTALDVVTVHAETEPSGFVQEGGETNLSGINIIGTFTLNGGVLDGTGIIHGDLINNGGYIAPGHSPGTLGVTGNFTQAAGGTLVLEDGGATPDLFDQIQVAGQATLGGNLDLNLINGYTPDKADTFSPLAYGSVTGKFASVSSNGTATINGTGLLTTVDPALPGPERAAALNISTRADVQTGDNVVIGGFIVTGPAGSTKKVIVRGIGPSLTGLGIADALSDPSLELHQGATVVATNDNWKDNQTAVQVTGLAPTDDLESAIVATLQPGAYTAVLQGAHGETGVGLVEVYDLDTTSSAALANISTRCEVQTGDNVMIGGFILAGSEPTQVLVRGVGPSLAAAGVQGVLADPVLEIHDANGEVITNNDWLETQEAEIAAANLAPTDSLEAAVLMTLPPGAYTAIVRGNNDGTGVGLVEVYNLQ